MEKHMIIDLPPLMYWGQYAITIVAITVVALGIALIYKGIWRE